MLIDKAMEQIGLNKSMVVVLYVLQHTDTNTKIFSRTYSQIQKDTGASQMTISKAFKVMQECGAVEYIGGSKWLNHAVIGHSTNPNGPDFYVENKGP